MKKAIDSQIERQTIDRHAVGHEWLKLKDEQLETEQGRIHGYPSRV